jgi:hypothetical protein
MLGIAVVVAAFALVGVAWMMAIKLGGRLAGEVRSDFVPQDDGAVASRSGSDWSATTLSSPDALRFSLDGPATSASTPLPAGQTVPASDHERPVAEGDAVRFCSATSLLHDVHVTLVQGDASQELVLPLVEPCVALP